MKEILKIINLKEKVYYNEGKYEGDFKNYKKEGKGIEYYNNDERFEGNFKNGIKRRKWNLLF